MCKLHKIVPCFIAILIIVVFLYKNQFTDYHVDYFYSSDLARTAGVAKNLYEKGEYSTQTIPLLALEKYKTIKLTDSGFWLNADRFPLSILVLYSFKVMLPQLSYMEVSYLFSFLTIFFVLMITCRAIYFYCGSTYVIVSLICFCFFPNFFVQAISKGGEDVLLFTLLVFLIPFRLTKKDILSHSIIVFLFIMLIMSRPYLALFVFAAYSVVYAKEYTRLKQLFILFFFSNLILLPWYLINYKYFGSPLFSVNSYVQLFFDLPISYNSNTWWLYKLKANEGILSFTVLTQLADKAFQFILSNTIFLSFNWLLPLICLGICLKHRVAFERSVSELICIVGLILPITLITLSFMAFRGAIVDYFVFIIPLLVFCISLVIKLYKNNCLNLYEIIAVIFGLFLYAFRSIYAYHIFDAIVFNIIFSFLFAIVMVLIAIQFINNMGNQVYKKTNFILLLTIVFLFTRTVKGWQDFANDFSIKNFENKQLITELKRAELVFSLNGFWGLTHFTDAKVLALPENEIYISEIAELLDVELSKVLIVISNPPKDVRQFLIPEQSSSYIRKFYKKEKINNFDLIYKLNDIAIWRKINTE